MALFVNTAELKRDTNHILHQITKEPAVITRHGHPCAALIALSGKNVEDLLWEFSPKVQRKIKQGLKEVKKGRGITMLGFARKYGLI